MIPTIDSRETIDLVNVVLAETARLKSPASEIRSVAYIDEEKVKVECFGMNGEPLVFHVTLDLMDEELRADLVEGTIA